MFRLSDEHIRAEYEAYTQMYLEDATPASVRGMAEMTLIKLGELVDKPQARRIKMVEKAFEEQRAAVERRKREAEQGELYCICRKPYNPTWFYISCDTCGDWRAWRQADARPRAAGAHHAPATP